MALSRTALFYRQNPKARRKHVRDQAEINKRPSEVKKRVKLNAYNRKHKDPVGNKTDAYHKGSKIVGFKSQKANRGDKNDSKGDISARGGRKLRYGSRKK